MAKRAEGEERAAQAHSVPKRRGRPVTREIKVDATPEQVARAMFAAAKPPNPSKRARRISAE